MIARAGRIQKAPVASKPRRRLPAWAPPQSDPSRKRILMVTLNYAPEQIGCGKYNSELAEDLVLRGHHVEVVCAPPYYPDWRIANGYSGWRGRREVRNGVTLHRVPLFVPSKPSGLTRIAHLASFGANAAPAAIHAARRFKPHLVFAVAPTLFAAQAALRAAAVIGAKSWLHVQDFELDAAFELGVLKAKSLRGHAQAWERQRLSRFDRVSSISSAMVSRLVEKGVPADRAIEFRNWVDVDAMPVFASSNTRLRGELGISPDEVIALYSGNMAAKQGVGALADVAALLEKRQAPVTLVLCGGGPARAELEVLCKERTNVRFLPLQPQDKLAELLGTADIHLLPQRPEAADLVLPSKLTGMLASGRPSVAMAAPQSGLGKEVSGCGLVVEANAQAMTQAILDLAADREWRQVLGANARRRAEDRWRKGELIAGFERDIKSVIGSSNTIEAR